MKKIVSVILSLAMLIGTFPMMTAFADNTEQNGWDGETKTAYTAGDGTKDSPYEIATAEQLAYFRDAVNESDSNVDGYYKLTSDIDLNDKVWIPIGKGTKYDTGGKKFAGTFDGGNHVIKNFKVNGVAKGNLDNGNYNRENKDEATGFFGKLGVNVQISNLGIENETLTITSDPIDLQRGDSVGLFVGDCNYGGKFTNCYVKNSSIEALGTNSNYDKLGGFVGNIRSSTTFENCYVYNISVKGGTSALVGGFAAGVMNQKDTTKFTDCYAAKIDITDNLATFYPFVNNSSTYGETTNQTDAKKSYSNMTHSQGGRTDYAPLVYKSDSRASADANESMTYAGMVDALVREDSAYVVKSNINDGWPALSGEIKETKVTELRGSGIEGDEYLISSAEELKFARDKINSEKGEGDGKPYRSAYYKLENDIDLGGQEWEPIGYYVSSEAEKMPNNVYFCGKFDGNGHVVKNFKITNSVSQSNSSYGFFGVATAPFEVCNFGIEDADISPYKESSIGGMVGFGDGTFTNCYVKNVKIGCSGREDEYGSRGGFIGTVRQASEFENCYVYNCELFGVQRQNVAGFVGGIQNVNRKFEFKNCYTGSLKLTGYNNGSSKAALYPFAYVADGTSHNGTFDINNVYSDTEGVEPVGTNTSSGWVNNYDADKSKGTIGVTKDTIVSEFNKVNLFKSDSAINDGYPALLFEKAKTNDVQPYVISAVKPGDTVKVTLKENKAETGAKLYVASYDNNGRVTAAEEKEATAGEITTGISSIGVAKVKAFVWDSDINPISDQFWGVQVNDGQFTEVIKVNADGSDSGSGDLVIPTRKTRVVTIGDSIMDSVNNGLSNGESWEKRGWEQYFPNYFDSDKTAFVKHGHSGWTIQYFMDSTCGVNSYHSCRWDTIKDQFGSGDYVILSLGTNDEGRMNGGVQKDKWEEYTSEQFKDWYKQVITDARAKGATVILTTPIPGSGNTTTVSGVTYFDDTNVCTTARKAIKEVGTECDVPVIDLSALFTAELNKMINGTDGYIKTSYAEMIATLTGPGVIYSDGVHMTETGADLIAKIIARELKNNNVATEILK